MHFYYTTILPNSCLLDCYLLLPEISRSTKLLRLKKGGYVCIRPTVFNSSNDETIILLFGQTYLFLVTYLQTEVVHPTS